MRRLFLAVSTLALLAAACRSAPQPTPEPTPSTAPGPQAPATPSTDPEAFRDQPPTAGPAPELVLPRFEQAVLDNGLTVLVSTRKELPLVYVGTAFAAGSASDPQGKWGLADLTYKMMLEGAAGKDTLALDQAFQNLGVSPSVSVGSDGAILGVRVLQRNTEAALALITQVVRQPTFAPKDFERRQKLQLAELVRALGSPGFLAQRTFLDVVFGAAHPYGHPTSGLPETVGSVTVRDVKAFYEKNVGPRTTALVMTGDITLEQAVALAKKSFGDWKGKAVLPPVPPAPPTPARGQVVFVPKKGLDQTIVLMGRPGIAAGHGDESALDLATTVFGGFFGSRLNMNLREDKGYSYGANSGSDARLGVGPLTASSSVRADVTGAAVTEFVNELQGLRERPITPRELEPAREGLIRAFPGSFESVEGLGASASELFLRRRPLDEYARTVAGLEKATPAEVQRVAEAYLGPDAMQIVLVGDPEVIQQQVEPLGLGKLVAREPAKAPAPKP
ncbi:peptidase, M16 family [Cystobacter fuscus DSM 2262]|uniref:Peptidase, M16 family n=1 Tax=Cystobacter fuscus (strain ATCC 25194 / DSM 2262 / NBRC 100088 / M29) TaxID=1242864 RepID=S9PNQ3_CYSF2|nr:pitrilysin family protein [Cystobacter fuscus]EPX64082.1 peptidase, M16 family [Cystobacter fuscus DSM 2262]